MKQSRAATSHTRRPVRQMRSMAHQHMKRESERAHHFARFDHRLFHLSAGNGMFTKAWGLVRSSKGRCSRM
jgi:hypothetical protein